MSKNTKIILIIFVILGCASAWYFYKQKNIQSVVKNSIRLCFIRNTEDGGHANMYMDISGSDVSGEFDWFPAQKDSKTGKFEGSISKVDPVMMARTLDVWWIAHAEGTVVKEQLKVIVGEGVANPGFGQMKDQGNGVYVYADPENISYNDLPLSDVDCGSEYPQTL